MDSKHVTTESHETTKEHSRKGRKKQNLPNNHKTISEVAVVSSHLSINTLNINELNVPVKRHEVNVWIKQLFR
jgi:hypothetical protein